MSGVTGLVPAFNKKLLDKYDVEARQMLKNVLGDSIVDNENKYGEDMVFTIKPFPFKFLEVQVYSKWDGKDFPYKLPFIYARKMKFSKETLFVTFNKYLSEMIIFGRECVLDKPSKLKKYDRENVHYVPWGKAMRITTDKLTPKLIKIYDGNYDYSTEPDTDIESKSSEN